MNPIRNPIYVVGDTEIDPLRGRLRKGAKVQPLRQKPLQVLLYLLDHAGRLVTKQELMDNVWKDTAVTDDALVQCVKEIRKALGDDSRNPQLVQTLPKLGYRFIGPVEERWDGAAGNAEHSVSVVLEYEQESPVPSPLSGLAQLAPPHRWTSLRLAAVLAIGLVAGLMLVLAMSSVYTRDLQSSPGPGLAVVPGKTSLVVMYFQNQTKRADLEWLREGLCDMLITDLSRSSKLQVLSRQHLGLLLEKARSRHQAPLSSDDVLGIARRAHVERLVTGSFTSMGGAVRLDAQLQNVATGEVLAAESLVFDKPEELLNQVDLLSANLLKHMQKQPDATYSTAGLGDLRTDNLDAYRYYSLAVEKTRGLHPSEAIELLQKAVALDPQFAMAHARIGYTYAVTWGMPDKGVPYLEKAYGLSGRLTDKEKLSVSAWYAISKRDYAAAINTYRVIIERNPDDVEAYCRLGALLYGEDQQQAALDVLSRGLLVDPDDNDLLNSIGGVYSAVGQHDKSIAVRLKYVALVPDEPNAHDSLGLSYEAAGLYEKAVQEYDRALELNPDFEVAIVHLGNAHYRLGQYHAALQAFERYVQVAPSSMERARGYGAIARVQWAMEQPNLAQAAVVKQTALEDTFVWDTFLLALHRGDLRQADRLLPRAVAPPRYSARGRREPQRLAHYYRGYFALKNGDSAQAIASFKEALRHAPPLWDIDTFEDCLADAYLELNRFDEAIAEYQRVLLLNPRYPLARFGLAQAYERKGLLPQARAEYENFLQVWKDADRKIPPVRLAEARVHQQF